MTTKIRELFVLLGLETDTKDFKAAEKAIDDVKKVAVALVGATVAASAVVLGLGRQSVRAADDLGRWQRRIGGTIEQLSGFKFAAEAAGLEGEKAFEAVVEIGERASDVVRNVKKLTGDAGESFKALGFKSVRELRKPNGELRDGIDLFDDALKRLSKIRNEVDRTGIAMRLFGDDVGQAITGADIDTLNKFRAEASALGATMSQENVAAARSFSLQFTILRAQLSGFRDDATFAALPAIRDILRALQRWISLNRKLLKSRLVRFARGLGSAFRQLAAKSRDYLRAGKAVIDMLLRMRGVLIAIGAVVSLLALQKIGLIVGAFGQWLVAAASLIPTLWAYVQVMRGMAVAQALAAAGPLLMGALFAALVLIFDEVITAANGGETALGDLADFLRKPFSESDSPFIKVLKAIQRLFDGLVRSAADLKEIFFGDKGPIRNRALSNLGERFLKGAESVFGVSKNNNTRQILSAARLASGVDKDLALEQLRADPKFSSAFLALDIAKGQLQATRDTSRAVVHVEAPITIQVEGAPTEDAMVRAADTARPLFFRVFKDAAKDRPE